jgi:iron complex outermembrane receptor protein
MVKHLLLKFTMLTVLSLFIGIVPLHAQKGVVKGRVTDASDGSPLPGATVVVKGSTSGTATDIDGNFSIEVEPSTVLVVSYIGYEPKEYTVQPGQTLNVSLETESLGLDEIVVIGYGVQKKDDATGSVAAISAKDFNKGQITSPSNLISGKIPGVQVTSSGGAPGSGSVIRIRGGSSLQASNDPLIVVDGVPLSSDGISGSRDPLSQINPNDIESVNVLKDASATAIYGSRASNGVIIITTKKGKKGQPLSLTYDGKFSFYTPSKTVDILDAPTFRKEIETRFPERKGMLGNANTDWQDQVFTSAVGTDQFFGGHGSTKHMPYRFSAGYTCQNGIIETDKYQRTTADVSLAPSMLDDHLTVNLNAKFGYNHNNFANQGAIGAANQFDPTKPVYSDSTFYVPIPGTNLYDTTNYGGYYAWTQPSGAPVELATANPVSLLNQRQDKSDVYSFIGNAKIDYKLHPLPELKFTLNLGMEYSKSKGSVFVDPYAAWKYDVKNGGGENTTYDQKRKNELLDAYATYDKNFKSAKSHLVAMLGYSWQHFYHENNNYSTNVPVKPTDTLVVYNQDNFATEYYLVSFFGRLNYTFADRYLFTFTLRDDGTSRFSPDTRWGLFPSVALAWRLDQERWLKDIKAISQMKIRLGWGITGQQAINQGDYPYLPIYTYSQPTAQYQFGNQFYTTIRAEGYDPNIKWEETTTWNAGLDFGFLEDRINGSFDYYYRETTDLINYIPVPAGSNLTNYITTNIGSLINKGVEFNIVGRPVVTKDWYWNIGLNFSYNTNEITKLTAVDDPNYQGVPTGGISGGVGNNIQIHSVGYPAYSFFVYEQVYDTDGKPIEGVYVDRNGDGVINDADKYHYEDPAANYYAGISMDLSYKNFTFSFSGRANFDNYIYNNVASDNGWWQKMYRPEGPYLSNVATSVYDTDFELAQYMSDYYVENGSFFRMDYISASYFFAKKKDETKGLRLTLTVNNAFVITKYSGIDPEIFNGIDNNIYPRPISYVFGVNYTF